MLIGHDEITLICDTWGCQNADEFYARMNQMTNEELAGWANKAKEEVEKRKKKKRQILENYLESIQKVYA